MPLDRDDIIIDCIAGNSKLPVGSFGGYAKLSVINFKSQSL